MFSIKCWY